MSSFGDDGGNDIYNNNNNNDNKRIRKRPVTFGNPALGTYEGVVYTTTSTLSSSNNNFSSTDVTTIMDHLVAMVDVPPEQVPDGILNLARVYRSYIKYVRIVISSETTTTPQKQQQRHYQQEEDEKQDKYILQQQEELPLRRQNSFLDEKQQYKQRARSASFPTEMESKNSPPISNSGGTIANGNNTAAAVSSSMSSSKVAFLPKSSSTASMKEDTNFFITTDSSSSKRRFENGNNNNASSYLLGSASSTRYCRLATTILQDEDEEEEKEERNHLIIFVLDSPLTAQKFIRNLNKKPYTSLDETQVANVQRIVGVEGKNGTNLFLSPIFPSLDITTKSMDVFNKDNNNNNTTSTRDNGGSNSEVHNCAVCLEPLFLEDDEEKKQAVLTTVCNHSFHLNCYWQWMDSPCPVCRYDHAGLNDASMLSSCSICGSTEHNYVCLICGVVSCTNTSIHIPNNNNNNNRFSSAVASSSSRRGDENDIDDDAPLFVSSRSHAQQHYDETLHAYALDTETQHVWDFCGRGYVHRLLQNASDGKMVEMAAPSSQQRLGEYSSLEAGARPPEAGRLSDRQENEFVHRKLEGLADKYITSLRSQLDQQRNYYEGRLEELRREHEQKCNNNKEDASTRAALLLQALKQERTQLQKRRERTRDRHRKVSEELSFVKNLNESLEANKEQIKRYIQEAKRERTASKARLTQKISPMELKLQELMLELVEEQEEGG